PARPPLPTRRSSDLARDFLLNDDRPDRGAGATTCNKADGQGCLGPRYDGYVTGGCRPTYVILLTDGEPNLDLQPWCSQSSPDFPDRKSTRLNSSHVK